MAANPLDLDVRGLLDVDAQLALLELPPQLRRRLLNRVTTRVRTMSRKRVREQKNTDGTPFAERKGSAKGKKKMEAGLAKLLQVNDERIENDGLRRAVDAGLKRLRLNATCSVPVPPAASAGGLADAGTAELTADARQDYFTLRDQIALRRQMILGLQDHVRRVCLR